MSTLSLLCRFCAKEQPQQSLVDLKTDKIYRNSIIQKLFIFREGLIDFTNKCLSETMCTVCCSILNASYDFFVQVQDSQVVLSRLCGLTEFENAENKTNQLTTKDLVKKEFVSLGSNRCDNDTIPDSYVCETEDHPSWSTYPWRCTHCNAILPSMQAVREHSQKTHGTCYGFQCADCNDKMDGFEEFVEHVVRKRSELVKYCEYCNMKIESPAHKDTHIANHNCTFCGQIFTNKISLIAHLKKYTTKDTGFLRFDMEISEDAQYGRNDTINLMSDTSNILYQIDIKDIDLINGKSNQNQTVDIMHNTANDNDTSNIINIISSLNDTLDSSDTTYRIENNNVNFDEVKKLNNTICRNNETVVLDYIADKTYNDTKILSWSEYPHICKFCNIKVAYMEMLKEHCMLMHHRCFGMKCVDCEYDGADTFDLFVRHVKMHRPYLKNICHYCDIKMNGFEEYHLQTHIDRYQCSVCGENFHSSQELRKHDNKLNSPVLKPPVERRKGPITDKDIACNICGKRMKTPQSLRAHKITHTERKRDHTCERCGKTFFTKSIMDAHHKIHEDIKKEMCKICNKSFLTVQRLRKHVKTHNLEMPFQCDDCKKFFSSKDSLRAHITVHMNIKPYVCLYCSKRFRYKHTMKTHENQHTGARPYGCDVCCINFACWSNCDKHMRRIHGIPLAKTVKTPHGKLAIDPETGRPSKVSITSVVKEWSKSILEKIPKQRKRKKQEKIKIGESNIDM